MPKWRRLGHRYDECRCAAEHNGRHPRVPSVAALTGPTARNWPKADTRVTAAQQMSAIGRKRTSNSRPLRLVTSSALGGCGDRIQQLHVHFPTGQLGPLPIYLLL